MLQRKPDVFGARLRGAYDILTFYNIGTSSLCEPFSRHYESMRWKFGRLGLLQE